MLRAPGSTTYGSSARPELPELVYKLAKRHRPWSAHQPGRGGRGSGRAGVPLCPGREEQLMFEGVVTRICAAHCVPVGLCWVGPSDEVTIYTLSSIADCKCLVLLESICCLSTLRGHVDYSLQNTKHQPATQETVVCVREQDGRTPLSEPQMSLPRSAEAWTGKVRIKDCCAVVRHTFTHSRSRARSSRFS